jgi:hypothetical protein
MDLFIRQLGHPQILVSDCNVASHRIVDSCEGIVISYQPLADLRRICVTGDLRSERRLFENREIRLTDLRHLRMLCVKEREVRDFGRVGAEG